MTTIQERWRDLWSRWSDLFPVRFEVDADGEPGDVVCEEGSEELFRAINAAQELARAARSFIPHAREEGLDTIALRRLAIELEESFVPDPADVDRIQPTAFEARLVIEELLERLPEDEAPAETEEVGDKLPRDAEVILAQLEKDGGWLRRSEIEQRCRDVECYLEERSAQRHLQQLVAKKLVEHNDAGRRHRAYRVHRARK